MSLSEKEFESGLAVLKASLDETDGQIKQLDMEAKDLLESVREYNKKKEQIAQLKKSRRAVLSNLLAITEFFQKITGHFPDGMYPLFSKENTERTEEVVTQ
jgi:septal ring factor EnvC (AmiA/AmiB activator)